MLEEKLIFQGAFDREFLFESYGVKIKVESNRQELLDEAKTLVCKALVDRVKFIESQNGAPEYSFGIGVDDGVYFLFQNGRQTTHGESKTPFFKYFNNSLRIEVAEHAVSKVFLHAGVVSWKGKAIVIPANSFSGKTTLTAELVKAGAEYYSDEYAVLDETGCVHPFPRKLGVRPIDGSSPEIEVSVEELGGRYGTDPVPVGLILITGYEEDGVWDPQVLSPGEGIIEVIPHTIPVRFNTEFSLKVLDTVARHAIIVKSARYDAKKFAKTLLDYVDNHVN